MALCQLVSVGSSWALGSWWTIGGLRPCVSAKSSLSVEAPARLESPNAAAAAMSLNLASSKVRILE